LASAQSSAIKVGIFTLFSLTVLFGVVYWLQSRQFKNGPAYTVSFPDVDGLREGAPVQLMGTRVGFVEAIAPAQQDDESYRVNVTFRMTDDTHPIPRASVLSIEQSGLISEKLLEVSPPHLAVTDVETTNPFLDGVDTPFALQLRAEGGWLTVGQVEKAQVLKAPPATPLYEKRKYTGYQLYYRVNTPGILLPNVPYFFLHKEKGQVTLRVDSYDPDWKPPASPNPKAFFTVEAPLRLREFFEIQIASAEALKETNDKINAILDAETIQSIQAIVANVKTLSGQTSSLIESTQSLLDTVNKDLRKISTVVTSLSTSVNSLIGNINQIVEDPELKGETKALVADLRQTILQAKAMLEDPELKQTLRNANSAAKNVNDVAVLAKTKLENENITKNLETSTAELNKILIKVNGVTEGEDSPIQRERLQQIVKDAMITLGNLKDFSEKLDGHFVLFRLLF